MCSIYGAMGIISESRLNTLRRLAADRGRDAHGEMMLPFNGGGAGVVGNWRGRPTTEITSVNVQPYGGFVHNGVISNDKELGGKPGEIDSEILPRVIRTDSLEMFHWDITKIKGSYAIACLTPNTVLLSCNYKPIYMVQIDGCIYFSSMKRHLEPLCGTYTAPVKMEPYSSMDLGTGRNIYSKKEHNWRCLVVASAGLDSTVAAAKMKYDGYDVGLLHFHYGCRAEGKEADAILEIAKRMDLDLEYMSLDYSKMNNSTLLDPGAEIATGIAGSEYAHEWVPARNLIMLSHAVGYAEANGYDTIVLGNNLEEAGAYPDNEEEFFERLNDLLPNAVGEGENIMIEQPLGALMKHEIVRLGLELGAPLDLTWSCYKDGETHCGDCGPCYMRQNAFKINGSTDPVRYGNE